MEIDSALKKLFALRSFGVKLGLDNIKDFLFFLGNPQLKLKTIHIAGSNGKGSTAAFITSILMEAGFKVGLYTSPHFVRYNERILINDKQIDDNVVAEFITHSWEYIIKNQLTFFEVTTALAFQYFNDMEVDYAIIETGLGGRLDATNVINPLGVVITSISLEHTNILGNNISSIAFEKASIIKQGKKVFAAKLEPEAITVVTHKSNEENCQLFRLEEYINEKGDSLELSEEDIYLDESNVPLKGQYQIHNAALAVLVVTKLRICEKKLTLLNGIINVVKNTRIQGRYEYLQKNPTLILDSAHNIAGITEFLSEFKRESKSYKKKIVLFGVLKDKAVNKMLTELNKSFDEIHLTKIDNERAAKIEDLKIICENQNITVYVETDAVKYIKHFLTGEKENCLVVIGSMYLLGEVKICMQ
ncbi:MAG: folylpolyglutamate synthase/dihydrofolate synthase family protein [Ignavibacteria bacterium]|nr:MAG: folylpolyglutamate synthase/dihydrofolate synthase family protein [Ignavibacteria bacterium]